MEAQVCRPRQNPVLPVPQPTLGTSHTVFIEKNCFLINGMQMISVYQIIHFSNFHFLIGKPINSMDLMKQTETDCPEAFLTFMRTVGSYKTNFANGISYDDYRDIHAQIGGQMGGGKFVQMRGKNFLGEKKNLL